jgi:hypothetical protein
MMLDRDLFEFLEHTTDAAFAVTDGGEICSWNSSADALSTATNYLGLCTAPVFITDTCRALAVHGMRDSIRPTPDGGM